MASAFTGFEPGDFFMWGQMKLCLFESCKHRGRIHVSKMPQEQFAKNPEFFNNNFINVIVF
jgi:hypothetical protein